ncbi:DUF1501 domain-containing protein [Flavobacterium rhizosphaerae]|uniref:DUF1501 domain-containing protein n=1 Tax=Flavobacterium rhizosphaerae TaxID=3163298 RepID=A0ABW8YRS9_9FLAO
MNRRGFFKLTGTCTGGLLLLPDFLYSFALQQNLTAGDNSLVFIQLNGGNDGLNAFIPYEDELYYKYRPNIAINKNDVIAATNGMAFHPALKGFAEIQQKGDLTVIQNVGYPEPNRSHFRSQEIWQTGSASNQYLSEGWLGRFLDLQCKGHQPTAGINLDATDNLALMGNELNAITVAKPDRFLSHKDDENITLSDNPQLDFVRKVANSVTEGAENISAALDKATPAEVSYPKSGLSKNLKWIADLIKGGLNSKVYYSSQSGYDTHNNQLGAQKNKFTELSEAVYAFYNDLKSAGKMQQVTIVVFSEFGRRVEDNGHGTDHGTAAPMFIIGGNTKGTIIGKNPNLLNLDQGDLIYETDFRSVYSALLKDKFAFDPKQIGITNPALQGLF